MRKFLSIITVALLLLSFTACSYKTGGSQDTGEAAVSQDSAATEDVASTVEPTEAGNLDDYYVKILEAKQDIDYYGNQAIIISFEYTNNGSESEAFASILFPIATQDGEELEYAYFEGSPDNNIDAYIKEIKPGETITVDVAFTLLSDSPVEVNVTGTFYNGETNICKTFTLE